MIYDDWGNDFDAVILGDNFLFNIVSDMNYEQSQKLMIQKSADALAVGGHFFWIMDTRYIRKNGFIIPMRILYRKVPTVMGTSEEWLYWIALFQEDSLKEDYSCHKVLTHELIHLCLMEDYPVSYEMSYFEDLNYTAFNEGFAHALTYVENIYDFVFDGFLEEKFKNAKHTLRAALAETDKQKQKNYSRMADTGAYWDKFASIAGKLYLLRHIDDMKRIYQEGWHDYTARILDE